MREFQKAALFSSRAIPFPFQFSARCSKISETDLIFDMVGRYPRIIADLRAIDTENFEHLCATWFALANDTRREDLASKLGPPPQRLCSDNEWRWQERARRGA